MVRAAMLAAEHEAKLEIVHVAPSVDRYALKRLGFDKLAGRDPDPPLRHQLDEAVALARSHNVTPTTKLTKGGAASKLVQEAERFGADLVVVGARGERSIKDAVIGTTAERLMERLSRDILVVRAAPKAAYDTVLICVALGPVSCFVVRSAISLSTQARLHMLHAFEPLFETKLVSHGAASETIRSHRLAAKREAAQALHTFLEQCVLPSDRHVATMLRRGNPPHEILIAAAHLKAGVIAVGKNQSAVEEFFLGSATKHIIRVASSDVLISAAH